MYLLGSSRLDKFVRYAFGTVLLVSAWFAEVIIMTSALYWLVKMCF